MALLSYSLQVFVVLGITIFLLFLSVHLLMLIFFGIAVCYMHYSAYTTAYTNNVKIIPMVKFEILGVTNKQGRSPVILVRFDAMSFVGIDFAENSLSKTNAVLL